MRIEVESGKAFMAIWQTFLAKYSSVERENLNLVGLAIRAERKVVDKIVDKLKFHQ